MDIAEQSQIPLKSSDHSGRFPKEPVNISMHVLTDLAATLANPPICTQKTLPKV